MGTIISQEIPYSGTTLSQQSLPIGAMIEYQGHSAPSGFLPCDGSIFSISLYPELANFYLTEYGSKNYFGGDGITTFATPDMRGEFPRGAGTNSHTNQGNGANVGEHQDGTAIPMFYQDNDNIAIRNAFSNNFEPVDVDSTRKVNAKNKGQYWSKSGEWNSTNNNVMTTRPTNTSWLFIVKAKSDRLDKITFAEVDDTSVSSDAVWSAEKIREAIGPESYSTSEQWTGKYWIDGKKIYTKTFEKTYSLSSIGDIVINHNVSGLESCVRFEAAYYNLTNARWYPLPIITVGSDTSATSVQTLYQYSVLMNRIDSTSIIFWAGSQRLSGKIYCTLEYTKTTT